jgi:hypothetical protein
LLASSPVAGKYQGFVVLLFCLVAAFGIRQLRYREFDIPSRLLFRGIPQKLTVERLGSTLERADTEENWWDRLAEAGDALGLMSMRLSDSGCVRRQWRNSDVPPVWSFRVTLIDGDSLEVEGPLGPGASSFDLIRFAEIVKGTFPGNRVQANTARAEKVASAHP